MTSYDKCCQLTLRRHDWITGRPAKIEAGMNFFVLMIEQLGGKTMFSCEGHGGKRESQPYLMFYGPLSLACAIAQTDSFVVEVQNHVNYFALRPYRWLNRKETMEQFLKRAAKAWVKAFGSPDLRKVAINPTLRRKKATPF